MSSILKDRTSQNFVRVEFEKIYKVLADEIKDPAQRISLIETVNTAEDNIIDVRKRRRDEIRKRLNKIDKTYHDNMRRLQQELEEAVQDLREYLMVGLEN
ncbi:hypothetical protein ACFL57_03560 [Candidatus Margulisiibacteriota bacterium]